MGTSAVPASSAPERPLGTHQVVVAVESVAEPAQDSLKTGEPFLIHDQVDHAAIVFGGHGDHQQDVGDVTD